MKSLKYYAMSFFFSACAYCANDALDAFLKTTQSFEGPFVQTVVDEDGDVLQSSKGRFISRKPDMYIWETSTPNHTKLVSNGKKVWFYDEELEQVTIESAETSQTAPVVLLAKDERALTERFKITEKVTDCDKSDLCFSLKPLDEGSDFSEISLVFDKVTALGNLTDKDANLHKPKIKRIILKDQLLNITKIEFDINKSLANTKLDSKIFTFSPPKGVDVVDNS